MLDISNNGIIQLTRGDSLKLPLFINANTDSDPIRYTLKSSDTIYFALLEPNQRFEDAILKKVFTYNSPKTEFNDIWITLKPSDTEELLPGKYYYTLKLKSIDNDSNEEFIRTIIPEKEFWILK